MNATDLPAGMLCSLPAAVRIRELRDAGQSDRLIRRRASLTGDQWRRARRAQPVGWRVAHRILNLPRPLTPGIDSDVHGPGARRRLQALLVGGWPQIVLADASGIPLSALNEIIRASRTLLTATEYRTVCALYDQRWNWRPEDHGVSAQAAQETRADAAERRYHGALAWDDETIDDRDVHARRGSVHAVFGADMALAMRALEGERLPLNAATRLLAIEYGARNRGLDMVELSACLRERTSAVRSSWTKIRHNAKTNGLPWADQPRWSRDGDADRRQARKSLLP